jgi:hypothetical protein
MKYDSFVETGARWLSEPPRDDPPDTSGSSLADVVSRPVQLYNNRGFRLRVAPAPTATEDSETEDKQSDDTEESATDDEIDESPQAGTRPLSVSLDQAMSFDWDAQEWDDWAELKQTQVETVDELLVTIAEWATWLGEEDLTGEAGVHAMLNEFMK